MLSELFSLENKVAIVTGAAGLLGERFCYALSSAGANVIAVDLDENKCRHIVDELPTYSIGTSADISSADSLNELKEKVISKFGRIDILVNNAAINDMVEKSNPKIEDSMFENYSFDSFMQVMKVNIGGVFLASQVIGKEMLKNNSGSIINIASTYGIVAPDQTLYQRPNGEQAFFKSPAYSTSKSAVIGFTKYLAAYFGKNGIRVNALSPGGVENNQEEYFINNYKKRTPLGRMANANDYNGALIYLASAASGYMTGANLVVDGGWTIC